MESRRILMYVLIAAITFLGIIGIVRLFTVSKDIREARRSIDSAVHIVKDSREIIRKQALTIDTMQLLNAKLYQKVHSTDSINRLIKQSIDKNLHKTNSTLLDIKRELDSLTIPVIH